jgi:hypothetical protein
MAEPRWAEIVGGPRDGQHVSIVGPVMVEQIEVHSAPDYLPESVEFSERVYDLRQWSDRSPPTYGKRYVLREMARGLGAEPPEPDPPGTREEQ